MINTYHKHTMKMYMPIKEELKVQKFLFPMPWLETDRIHFDEG